jgi:hypothetical protein
MNFFNEIIIIIIGVLAVLVYFMKTSGTVTEVIPRTIDRPYHTYTIDYLYLGSFRRRGEYKRYKWRQKFNKNTGVYVYLDLLGNIKKISYQPVIKEETNIQFLKDCLKLTFILILFDFHVSFNE